MRDNLIVADQGVARQRGSERRRRSLGRVPTIQQPLPPTGPFEADTAQRKAPIPLLGISDTCGSCSGDKGWSNGHSTCARRDSAAAAQSAWWPGSV